ncbi:MAG: hypothetical protein UX91_C0001G0122 [Candidatus Amesbacteria bacterium GW2011_GWB1_47_19]|nr:MAG: hypothetical protein UW51_C0001G0122 [Candidatus Amesbacteria bacterium GW2011_GWA1_44_24]KKU32134.1 MAG: hypothetical protein UX46_C0001G0121 [Candidatus Amesbacteria bacterium GW2011_GWC1_46_24]KKU67818.1 MAG: hypothetical protein UX91_C0001G0122 [Candidatus Amesbacteria bacterium GW2011_GWB1_47_19]OGD05019.1 MAG: hypothetical protein A2379_03905 [Candidatus Amesbacteria bacterium RIFOXYB1_FULL_47_13]HBC72418.1 hypothetical protein [Candidatus Amesbacteria bacterium]
MKKRFLHTLILLYSSSLTLFSSHASAADVNLIDPASPYNKLYTITPRRLVTSGINLFLGAAGIIAFIYLLVGGIQWIMSGGDKEGIERARKRILHALVGLSIVLSSYALITIVRILFNINSFYVNLNTI